jgi:hypothetical protein
LASLFVGSYFEDVKASSHEHRSCLSDVPELDNSLGDPKNPMLWTDLAIAMPGGHVARLADKQ